MDHKSIREALTAGAEALSAGADKIKALSPKIMEALSPAKKPPPEPTYAQVYCSSEFA